MHKTASQVRLVVLCRGWTILPISRAILLKELCLALWSFFWHFLLCQIHLKGILKGSELVDAAYRTKGLYREHIKDTEDDCLSLVQGHKPHKTAHSLPEPNLSASMLTHWMIKLAGSPVLVVYTGFLKNRYPEPLSRLS